MSIPDELRGAAKSLRCDHSYPIQPPHGSIFRPGPCSACGTPWDDRDPVPDYLQVPLAGLLEDLSRLAKDHPIDPDYAGMPVHRWCMGCDNEECDALNLIDRARDVIRALAGALPPPAPAPAAIPQETPR